MQRASVIAIDTGYLDISGAASCFLVLGPEAPVLVECGCAVAFERIRAALAEHGARPSELAALFVTHVHLDHAGAAGHFAREGVPVHVHPRGARHLIDPTRLIAGSRAVHGPRYERHYGDPIPIDPALVRAIGHGEWVVAGGLRWTAIETPGHARHHHAWLQARLDGTPEAVYSGDVLGMVSPGSEHISIPVPPSDIDIPAWRISIERLRALPQGLEAVLTHGGGRSLHGHVDAFVARMNEELPLLGELVEVAKSDAAGADARYREFLMPRARESGLDDGLAGALLGKAFRAMNLAGVAEAVAAGRFAAAI